MQKIVIHKQNNPLHKNVIRVFSTFYFLLSIFCFVTEAHAADSQMQFVLPSSSVGVGDEFAVPLTLRSGDQKVNTISGDIVFSDSTVRLARVSTANSIITSWIDQPILSGNSVTFSGIIAGGFEGVIDPTTNTRTDGVVITLYFEATHQGTASISFADFHAYLNDGMGTEATLSLLPLTFVVEKIGTGMKSDILDTVPPESFTPIVSAIPDLYDGAYALFFQTTDKGSGLSHYEVSEAFGPWKRVTSPHLLSDQSLRGPIRVKAVDEAGNYRIETMPGAGLFNKNILLIPFGLVGLLVLWIFLVYKKKMKKKYI